MNWYYKDGDKEIGPVADEAMKALIEAGVVNASSLVKQDGMSEWVTLAESELASIKQRSPIPSQPISIKTRSLLNHRIGAFIVDLSCVLLLSSASSMIKNLFYKKLWDPCLDYGFIIFSIIWLILNVRKGISPGRWLFGIQLEKADKPLKAFGHITIRWLAWLFAVIFISELLSLYIYLTGYESIYSYNDFFPSYLKSIQPSALWLLLIPAVLIVPLIWSKGKKGLPDYLSRAHAVLRSHLPCEQIRYVGAWVIGLIAITSFVISFNIGLLSRLYYSPDHSFSIVFPRAPKFERTEDGGWNIHSLLRNSLDTRIAEMRVDYYAANCYENPNINEDNIDFDRFETDELILAKRDLKVYGHKAREWIIIPDNAFSTTLMNTDWELPFGLVFVEGKGIYIERKRIFAVGQRLFILIAGGPASHIGPSSVRQQYFMDSFRLNNVANNMPPVEYISKGNRNNTDKAMKRINSTNTSPVAASETYPNQSAGQDNIDNQRSVYDSINRHYNAVTLPSSAAEASPLNGYKPRPVTPVDSTSTNQFEGQNNGFQSSDEYMRSMYPPPPRSEQYYKAPTNYAPRPVTP